MTSLIHLQSLWNLEYNNLFENLDKFIEECENKLKKFKCENPEFRHYQKEKNKRYGKKINNLFNSSLLMNAMSFMKIEQKAR